MFLDYMVYITIPLGGITTVFYESVTFSRRLISGGTATRSRSGCSDYGAATPPKQALH